MIDPGGNADLAVSGGAITLGGSACLGATTTNTDSISVTGNVGTSETLVLDERGGVFAPGASSEFNIPEIEMSTSLGDASDTVVLHGTEGPDSFAPGQFGLALNSDGDVDVLFNPGIFKMEIYGHGGVDYINGRGQGGAGLHFLGPLIVDGGEGDDTLVRGSSDPDIVRGGPGNDRLEGQEGNDLMDGGPGDDTIAAGPDDDLLIGGPGRDTLIGADGNDELRADDGEADAELNGSRGIDTAYYEAALDSVVLAVENKITVDPPPPAAPCMYNAATREVSANVASGTAAVLAVSAGQIVFGSPAVACGAATTGNTENITVTGDTGAVEQLTIDQTGGAFEGGAAESGTPEVEIAVQLGDAADGLVVIGTGGNDVITIGVKGVSTNADGDLDVTLLAPLPARIEVQGRGGVNTINGRGGTGTGALWAGSLYAYAGDLGDTLRGGNGDDTLVGGAGVDVLEGREGNDTLTGGGGNDKLAGNVGNDLLTGGAGNDSFAGSDGDDVMHAEDGEAETGINGGPGTDTAYYDSILDPNPLATEFRIPV